MNICLNCKSEYIARYPNQRYCSEKCSKEARRKSKIEKQKEYNKAFISPHRQQNANSKRNKISSLDETVRKIEEYNKEHGTRLSYGDWQVKKFFGEV